MTDVAEAVAKGPAWVEPLFKNLQGSPAARLRVTETASAPGAVRPTARVYVSFDYLDPGGKPREARAKLYLPESVKQPGARLPVYVNSGYELPDTLEREFLKRGWIVVSPRELGTNPLIRTVNPDVALLHMVRALPFVDDARVLVGGGSAGGYTTLLVAAETFPLAGAAPDVPPVNWGYNAAFLFDQADKTGPKPGTASPRLPVTFAVGSMLAGCRAVYGTDRDDPVNHASSPLAHVPTITCPVSVDWSTADMLVPMNQVGKRWVQPFDAARFPEGFTMDPERLLKGREGRLTLIDVLPASQFEAFTLTVPPGTSKLGTTGNARAATTGEFPMSERPWSIVIVDEGPPEPTLGHRKFDFTLTRNTFFDRVMTGKVEARQLTAVKLQRLMDRYAGKEWLPTRLKHLDLPESERADVLRGVRTYVASGPANARTFADLYAQLPPARQVLDPAEVKRLTETGGTR